jgi:predicted Fe-Mo cluster-binding NifX family protein
VSGFFGKANIFTIVGVQDIVVKNVKVLKNPAVSYKHGVGAIVVCALARAN